MQLKLRAAHDPASAHSYRLKLARLHRRAGEPEKAVNLYRYGIVVEPSREAYYRRKIGDIYSDQGLNKKAEEEYRLAEEAGRPGNKIRSRRQLEIWEEEGRYDLLLQQYWFLYWTRPHSRPVYLRRIARILREGGEEEKARRYYRRLIKSYQEQIKKRPERALDYTLRIAELYREIGEPAAAAEEYKRAVKLEGKVGVTALLEQADFYRSQGSLERALDLYRQAEKRGGDDLVSIRLKIANVYDKKGEISPALKWMKKAASEGGEEADRIRLKIARYLERHNRPEEALAAYRQVLPQLTLRDQARGTEDMGKILAGLGRDDEARDAYRAALDLWKEDLGTAPADPFLLERMAELAEKAGQPEAADGYYDDLIAAYRDRLEEDPERSGYYHRELGGLYRDRGHYPEAIEEYQFWSRIEPENPDPHYRLHRIYRDHFSVQTTAEYYYARYRELREKKKGKNREDQGEAGMSKE